MGIPLAFLLVSVDSTRGLLELGVERRVELVLLGLVQSVERRRDGHAVDGLAPRELRRRQAGDALESSRTRHGVDLDSGTPASRA